MATGLMELASQLNLPLSYLSSQAHDRNVHFRWDHEIRSGKRHGFKGWAGLNSHIMWFDVQPKKVEESRKIGCRNILVAMHARLEPTDLANLPLYDKVVCPTDQCYQALRQRCAVSDKLLTHVPWDSGMPLTTKRRNPGDPLVLFVPVDSFTAQFEGSLLCYTLRVLMDGDPNLQVVLSYTSNWTRASLGALHDLQDRFKGQLTTLRKPTFCDRLEAYRKADWVLHLGIEGNAAMTALESVALGVPVIAFNVPPNREIIRAFYNGYLIECGAEDTRAGSVRVSVNSRRLLDSLTDLLANDNAVRAMQGKEWPELETRRRNFQAFWKKLWGYEEV
jgi:hypothetical protein